MKEVLLLSSLFLFLAFCAIGQKSSKYYRNQLTIVSENDNYTFKYKDRYYTNGLFIRFSRAIDQGISPQRPIKILNAEIGQMIFVPYLANLSFRSTMDRPFTGFLYGKAGLSDFTKGNNVLRWNVLAGVVGEAACGKEVQRWHHQNFNLPYPYGWETQLKSEPGATFKLPIISI